MTPPRTSWLRLLAVTALALAVGCGGPPELPSGPPDPTARRALVSGTVVGFAHPDGGHAWLGIPFAQPPVGPLRWRAPRPPEPWEGERPALAYGHSCVQFAGPRGGRDGARSGQPTGSEDCLTLNVFAPRYLPGEVPTGDARLPVMVWIHGGGNSIGDATLYDGARLATAREVMVVTVHYRLGVFGWLSHPAIRHADASPEDASGNYGTLDLVRALVWVRENAAAFGGDPGRVTVFGESAGGGNVFTLLVAPPAAGLFHRAIVQSGGLRTTSRAEAEHFADDAEPGHARSSGELLLDLLQRQGVAADRAGAQVALAAMDPAEIAATLRGLDAPALLSLFDGDLLGGMYESPRLFRDGVVLRDEEFLESLRAGRSHPVPTLLGTNRDETRLFLMFTSPHVSRIFGIPWRLRDAERYALESEYPSLLWKALAVDEPAIALAAARQAPVFAYRFDWDDEARRLWVDLGKLLGAAHGMEIPFVFGRLSFFGMPGVFDDARRALDLELSRAITSYWTQFAATGDPGRGREGSRARWMSWSEGDGHKYLILDSADDGGIRMGSEAVTREQVIARVATDPRFESDAERCAVWGGFVRWSEAMTEEQYRAIADGVCRGVPLPDRR